MAKEGNKREQADSATGRKSPKRTRKDEPKAAEAAEAAVATASSAAAIVPLPRIPAATNDSASGAATPARSVLSGVVPWVLSNLREYIKTHSELFDGVADVPVHEHLPLLIAEAKREKDSSPKSLKNYKAPWSKQAASDALATTAMYEAAGNVVWTRLFPVSEEMEKVAGAPVLWEQVVELAENFFSTAAYVSCTTDAATHVKRIVFPITMYVNAPVELDIGRADHFNSCLDLISGHAYLYAWWYAMFKALRDDAATLVASLWQCGLTATIHLRQGLDVKAMAEISCAQSELHKSSDKMVSDSFPAFARKAMLIAPTGQEPRRTQILKDAGVRYNGGAVNRVCVAGLLADRLGAQSAARCAATPPRYKSSPSTHLTDERSNQRRTAGHGVRDHPLRRQNL